MDAPVAVGHMVGRVSASLTEPLLPSIEPIVKLIEATNRVNAAGGQFLSIALYVGEV